MKKALFLDRDGILNDVIMREGGASSPLRVDEFRITGAATSLVQCARRKHYQTIVITNQPDISRGKLHENDLRAMHAILKSALGVDHIEVCTSDDDSDPRRKPNPGMILDIANSKSISLKDSFLIGDGEKDIVAGKRAGVRTILLRTNYNSRIHGIGDINIFSLDEVDSLL